MRKLDSSFLQRADSLDAPSVASDDSTASSVDSNNPVGKGKKKGRDEEFEELLERYNVDEIEEKPKNFYSPFCNKWISLFGVPIKTKTYSLRLATTRFFIIISCSSR